MDGRRQPRSEETKAKIRAAALARAARKRQEDPPAPAPRKKPGPKPKPKDEETGLTFQFALPPKEWHEQAAITVACARCGWSEVTADKQAFKRHRCPA